MDVAMLPIGWTDVGAGGLVALVVLLIFLGRLVPPGLVSAKERDYWRDAFFQQQEINRELASTGRATRDVLRAIPDTTRADEVGR